MGGGIETIFFFFIYSGFQYPRLFVINSALCGKGQKTVSITVRTDWHFLLLRFEINAAIFNKRIRSVTTASRIHMYA